MADSRRKILLHLFLGLAALVALIFGVALGFALAATFNNPIQRLGEYKVALPSQILDRNGELITEFFSEEKREIVSIDELPKNLIYALITREDQDFFHHHGINVRGLFRAGWNIMTGQYFSGASSITQLTVGQLGYVDRTKITITRKLKEMWYALQLERVLTKTEILEILLNGAYFGSGTYGVEAASQFYFQHSARELTLAESVLLVMQISAPGGKYSPLRHPNNAQKIQWEVLQQMVELGYTTRAEAEKSFNDYWSGYDYTRPPTTVAILERPDKAPWFSEYIRTQLEQIILGSKDFYRDGFVVHTTLDLNYQKEADKYFSDGLSAVNRNFQANENYRFNYADETIAPLVDLLSLTFDMEEIRVAGSKKRQNAKEMYRQTLNPTLDLLSLMFGVDELKYSVNVAYKKEKEASQKTTVEGALITLENETGHILAMVGGSEFDRTNQLNRALQASVMPGSSFKPLYYSAAIDSRKLTPASAIWDGPVIFWNDDGTPYKPYNYKGEWVGWVLLRQALAHSMNVPSIKVLDTVGFDAAIQRAALLLGKNTPGEIASFPRKYPLGLGVISVAPIQMAKAYSVFANQGREVVPVGIRYIEDRNGSIILEPEREVRALQAKKGKAAQLISPQTAYVMTNLLQTTVQEGTLHYASQTVAKGFKGMPMAGKTGTTQNWSDAWTVGFSPYMTTAIWYGFDKPGNSLGVWQTGATVAGPVWARYMKAIHKDLPVRDFVKPATGIREVTVCALSGLLPTDACDDDVIKEVFLEGTEPKRFCDLHDFQDERDKESIVKIQDKLLTAPIDLNFDDLVISPDLLDVGGTGSQTAGDPTASDGGNPFFEDTAGTEQTDDSFSFPSDSPLLLPSDDDLQPPPVEDEGNPLLD